MNHEIVYRADEVEKVEVRLPKKRRSISPELLEITIGCLGAYAVLAVIGLAMAPG